MGASLTFSRRQRRGLAVLALLVIVFQIVLYGKDIGSFGVPSKEETEWMATQRTVDSLKTIRKAEKPKRYPFNPNFISDYKGYRLGMSVAEIDRLLAFRKTGRYVNSAREFQKVTGVSDSLLARLSPFFRFPEWVKHRHAPASFKNDAPVEKRQQKPLDINTATQEELMKVYGIGPALSERILKLRDKFGAFVSIDQLELVWGLRPEALAEVKKAFVVGPTPAVKKVRINEATFREIMQTPYFNYNLTKEVMVYRSMHSGIKNAEDLANVEGFPIEKLKIISLYLEF